MSSLPLVSFSIVNYNGRRWLFPCLESVHRLDYPAALKEVFVVDNGSTDDSLDGLALQYPWVQVVKNEVNNYCVAHNLAIDASRGAFVAVMNNDVDLDPGWLRALLETMLPNPRVGIAMSQIRHLGLQRIQGQGMVEYPDFWWGYRGAREADRVRYATVEEVPYVAGTAVLFRRECLKDIGGLDASFHCRNEDVDFSLRCWQRGWRLCYVPDAIAGHAMQGTFTDRERDFLDTRNRLLIAAKHFPAELPELIGSFAANRLGDPIFIGMVRDVLTTLVRVHPGRDGARWVETVFQQLAVAWEQECRVWTRYGARCVTQHTGGRRAVTTASPQPPILSER